MTIFKLCFRVPPDLNYVWHFQRVVITPPEKPDIRFPITINFKLLWGVGLTESIQTIKHAKFTALKNFKKRMLPNFFKHT